MRKYYYKEDPYVICPYYFKENSLEIKCAGIIANHTTSTFTTTKKKSAYKAKYCNSIKECCNCPIYQLLEKLNK